MNEKRLFRSFPVDLEEGDGRTLSGLCVPYETPGLVQDDGLPYEEMFARGAFARDPLIRKAPNRVELLYDHGSGLGDTVGYGVSFEERDDPAPGLWGTFRALETEAGNQALALTRAGILRFLSVGFDPRRSRKEGGILVRLAARLGEVSLVREAAYAGTGVRVRAKPPAFPPPGLEHVRDPELDRRLGLLGFGQ